MRTAVDLYVTCPNCSTEFMLPQAVSGTKVRSASDIVPLIAHFGHDEKETFRVISLNGRNIVMAIDTIASGTYNAVSLRIGDAFREPLQKGASGIVVVHNHPSGDVKPSKQDDDLTHEINKAGKLLQVAVVDHIILGRNGEYTSYRNEGKLNYANG